MNHLFELRNEGWNTEVKLPLKLYRQYLMIKQNFYKLHLNGFIVKNIGDFKIEGKFAKVCQCGHFLKF